MKRDMWKVVLRPGYYGGVVAPIVSLHKTQAAAEKARDRANRAWARECDQTAALRSASRRRYGIAAPSHETADD